MTRLTDELLTKCRRSAIDFFGRAPTRRIGGSAWRVPCLIVVLGVRYHSTAYINYYLLVLTFEILNLFLIFKNYKKIKKSRVHKVHNLSAIYSHHDLH